MKKCIIMALILSLASFVSALAEEDCTASYITYADWGQGHVSGVEITNHTADVLEDWVLEFNWNRRISSIWNARILEREDLGDGNTHYVIAGEHWNKNLEAYKTINWGWQGDSGGITYDPEEMTVGDLYSYGERKDFEWQAHMGTKTAEAMEISLAEYLYYDVARFASFQPFTLGYGIIEKKEVNQYLEGEYRWCEIETPDGATLEGVFFPVENPRGTIIAVHGRGSHLYWAAQKLQCLVDGGYQVLAANGRFWDSFKAPETYMGGIQNDLDDLVAVVDYVKNLPEVDSDKLGVIGFSYGGLQVTYLAHIYEEVKVLILDGSQPLHFTADDPDYFPWMPPDSEVTWPEMASGYFELLHEREGITREQYTLMDNVVSLRNNIKPTLVLAGGQDPYVPVYEARQLYDLTMGPKEFHVFPNSGHCDAVMGPDKEAYEGALLNFLSKYF